MADAATGADGRPPVADRSASSLVDRAYVALRMGQSARVWRSSQMLTEWGALDPNQFVGDLTWQ